MSETRHNKKTCFIITPIGKEGSEIRRKADGIIDAAINPVLEECGFEESDVSHRIQNSGSMTAEIIKGIYYSDLVIANLTGTNANVMYEVAIRHCAGKPIIHITEDINSIPFDINDHRCIEYRDDAKGVIELRTELKKKINHILENSDQKVSNPVLDYLEKTKIIQEPENKNITVIEAIKNLENHILKLDFDIKKLKAQTYNINYIDSEGNSQIYNLIKKVASLDKEDYNRIKENLIKFHNEKNNE